MENRTKALYNEIMMYFKNKAPTLEPEYIMTDFERALQTALANSWPNASLILNYLTVILFGELN